MAVETRYADSNTTVLAGCSGVTNAYGAPDGTYTTNTAHDNWTERFGIGNPNDPLTAGATDHTVTVTLRKSAAGGNGNPTCAVALYDNGTLVRTLQAAVAIGDATTSLGPYTFATAEVAIANNVEVQLDVVGQGGAPAGRRNVQVDGITVDFNTTAAAGGQNINVGQVTETDAAQAVTERKSRAVNQATGSDVAQAAAHTKARAVPQATETGSARPVARRKRRRLRATGAVGSITVG